VGPVSVRSLRRYSAGRSRSLNAMAANFRLEADCGEAVERGLPNGEVTDRVLDVQGGYEASICSVGSTLTCLPGASRSPRQLGPVRSSFGARTRWTPCSPGTSPDGCSSQDAPLVKARFTTASSRPVERAAEGHAPAHRDTVNQPLRQGCSRAATDLDGSGRCGASSAGHLDG
jgi:hypothetical protein